MIASRHPSWALLLLLAACGEAGDPTAGKTDEQLRREIEAVAVPKPDPKDLPPPFRLRPLKVGEVRQFVSGQPACTLLYRGRIFFATNGNRAIANVDGGTRQLLATGPVGPTGGFFSVEGATISIGRIAQFAGGAEAYVPAWPVDVAVGGAAEIQPQRFEAGWTCRGAGKVDIVPAQ
jgi:hypothetical protein